MPDFSSFNKQTKVVVIAIVFLIFGAVALSTICWLTGQENLEEMFEYG